jgi:hypothetical protein
VIHLTIAARTRHATCSRGVTNRRELDQAKAPQAEEPLPRGNATEPSVAIAPRGPTGRRTVSVCAAPSFLVVAKAPRPSFPLPRVASAVRREGEALGHKRDREGAETGTEPHAPRPDDSSALNGEARRRHHRDLRVVVADVDVFEAVVQMREHHAGRRLTRSRRRGASARGTECGSSSVTGALEGLAPNRVDPARFPLRKLGACVPRGAARERARSPTGVLVRVQTSRAARVGPTADARGPPGQPSQRRSPSTLHELRRCDPAAAVESRLRAACGGSRSRRRGALQANASGSRKAP